MKISFTAAGVRQTTWRDYAVRFLFGGALTAGAGWIAQRYGPGVGGVFLAFPAILPASLTLLAAHERERKAARGMSGALRGGRAAALDALGATLGSVGLVLFAAIVWQFLPAHQPGIVLSCAAGVWAAAAYVSWRVRKSGWRASSHE